MVSQTETTRSIQERLRRKFGPGSVQGRSLTVELNRKRSAERSDRTVKLNIRTCNDRDINTEAITHGEAENYPRISGQDGSSVETVVTGSHTLNL